MNEYCLFASEAPGSYKVKLRILRPVTSKHLHNAALVELAASLSGKEFGLSFGITHLVIYGGKEKISWMGSFKTPQFVNVCAIKNNVVPEGNTINPDLLILLDKNAALRKLERQDRKKQRQTPRRYIK